MTEPRSTPRRILVVANRTACGDDLLEVIESRLRDGPCRFTLLVPATPPSEHGTWTEGSAKSLAKKRIAEAQERFREHGVGEVEGVVGDPHPAQAIDDVLIDHSFDEIILSTLPPGISRWLHLDLPRRVEQRFGLPMTTVIATTQPVS